MTFKRYVIHFEYQSRSNACLYNCIWLPVCFICQYRHNGSVKHKCIYVVNRCMERLYNCILLPVYFIYQYRHNGSVKNKYIYVVNTCIERLYNCILLPVCFICQYRHNGPVKNKYIYVVNTCIKRLYEDKFHQEHHTYLQNYLVRTCLHLVKPNYNRMLHYC